jgi:hypothetical protein
MPLEGKGKGYTVCLWRASERKLGKKPVTKPKKTLEKSREQG